MADVRFLKSEVVIIQPLSYLIYLGFEIDLKIAKPVMLVKLKMDFQLYMAAIFKVL